MTTHFTAVECLGKDEHLWWFMWHLLEYVDVLAKKNYRFYGTVIAACNNGDSNGMYT